MMHHNICTRSGLTTYLTYLILHSGTFDVQLRSGWMSIDRSSMREIPMPRKSLMESKFCLSIGLIGC